MLAVMLLAVVMLVVAVGRMVAPAKHMSPSSSLEPVNVTLFGERFFVDVKDIEI